MSYTDEDVARGAAVVKDFVGKLATGEEKPQPDGWVLFTPSGLKHVVTIPGELARVTGLSRPEAGLGNRALVKEGFATMLAPGWYQVVNNSSNDV